MAGVKGLSGRRKQPTEMLRLRGAFEKDPQRLAERAHEPAAVEGIPKPPAYLDRIAKKAFRDVAQHLSDLNVLSRTDRSIIELYAATYSRWRNAQGPQYNQLSNILVKCLVQMGLTPSARASLHVDKPDALDPTEQFLARVASG